MAVDVAGGRDRRVPEQIRDRFDGTPCSSHATAALCRKVCTPTSFTPALRAAVSMVRTRLRGSTGVPNSVANTSPQSVH